MPEHESRRIQKLLVANRGEIARRILRTAKAMGLSSVAVFSDEDEHAPHVLDADEAVRIGGNAASESYLSVEKILSAAKRTGADAIHPGYGFLAENPALAEACVQAGVVFVGPSADVIRDLGSKQRSKEIVRGAGVPVVPGYEGEDQSDERLHQAALKVGFPVLIKASAGGGGKGMRVITSEPALAEGLVAARREAQSAFGDPTLLIERYIERPRHIEVQIMGDAHGHLVHLFERECSIQRRHQKIVEESPSMALTDTQREDICQAAVKVGKAVGYENAGTVEFIMSPKGEFFFLEVNTRLQVEHPVTECITGLDLVELQLRVAQGEALEFESGGPEARGAAIECRLYAEDAERDFLPTTGTVQTFAFEPAVGLRVDSGVESGSKVGIHYDPMLAKFITSAADRATAVRLMMRALSGLRVHGITTNREFLLRVLQSNEFALGHTDTHFIQRNAEALTAKTPESQSVHRAALAAALSLYEARGSKTGVLPGLRPGYRNSRSQREWMTLATADASEEIRVAWEPAGRTGYAVCVNGQELSVNRLVRHPDGVTLEADGLLERYWLTPGDDSIEVQSLNLRQVFREVPRFPMPGVEVDAGACIAPMPGKVISVAVEPGAAVEEGETLVVLEAMKMEHTVRAACSGTVQKVNVAQGQQVEADEVLVVVGTEEP